MIRRPLAERARLEPRRLLLFRGARGVYSDRCVSECEWRIRRSAQEATHCFPVGQTSELASTHRLTR